jgi:thiamine-monophosphate kinase
VADLGEWGIIAALRARMPAGRLTSVGIGDDAAVVTAPSGSTVAAVDMLIEGRHFRRDWSSARDIGTKAAARSLADIAAMGAVNTALLVALATPGTLAARWATDLADGLAAEAVRAGAGIVGGDTASADSVLVSVTALGDLEGRRPVLRSGARPGDVIAVAGPLGRSAAGLALLTAGDAASEPAIAADRASGGDQDLASLVAAHRAPAPPYDAGPEAARLGATAMIDVSDGLLADLGHVAAASGVRVNVSSEALPAGTALLAAAASLLSRTPSARTSAADSPATMALDWLLTGGEDHALVAAFPPGTGLPARWQLIGEASEGSGVTVDGGQHQGSGGWQHFH